MNFSNLTLTSLCSLSLLAIACGTGAKHEARNAEPNPDRSGAAQSSEPSAFPSEPAPSVRGFEAEESAAAPAAAPPAEARREGAAEKSADAASRPQGAPAPKSRSSASPEAFDLEQDRPGLGTTFGEARTSHVHSSPFERQNPRSPFAVTTVHYNDRTGIQAMLRGASFADFRSEGVQAGRGMLTVRVVDDNGVPLPTLSSGGRSLVVGEHGQRYAIEIQNHTNNRFEAVVTVDGLDVIDGRPGSFSKRGYLVQPFATVEIDGFRTSMDEVATFRFGSVRNSYAGKKGDDRNVGVIGVALFEERGASFPWTQQEIDRRNRANPFPGGFAEPPLTR